MTTNQTIDGVPRSLLIRLWNLLHVTGDNEDKALGELRALLDEPVIAICRGCFTEQPMGRACKTCAEVEAKRAAQPQGEPVAWQNVATGHVTTSAVVVMDWDDEKEQVQSLYAEQPAPVALTQDAIDRIVPSLNPEPDRDEFHCEWALWSDRERIRNKLSTLLTANPAPVAVVPERLNHADGLHTYEYVTGHNAAIDKMLGVKS